jgi:hypothetical protein
MSFFCDPAQHRRLQRFPHVAHTRLDHRPHEQRLRHALSRDVFNTADAASVGHTGVDLFDTSGRVQKSGVFL